MSGIIVPNVLEVDLLTNMLSATGIAGGNLSLRLAKNDFTVGLTVAQIESTITNASFTEATFAGYAAATLTAASWVITGGDPSQATYATQTFQRSSTGTAELIYGYWVRRVSDSRLMWFERFTGPLSVEFIGQQVVITPTFRAKDYQDA